MQQDWRARQDYSVFEFDANESQCFRQLGCHLSAGLHNIRMARFPQQSDRRIAQRHHQLRDVTAPSLHRGPRRTRACGRCNDGAHSAEGIGGGHDLVCRGVANLFSP